MESLLCRDPAYAYSYKINFFWVENEDDKYLIYIMEELFNCFVAAANSFDEKVDVQKECSTYF